LLAIVVVELQKQKNEVTVALLLALLSTLKQWLVGVA
jgi:hypothetical protein